MGPLRQFVRFAKPWQRAVLGVALTAVGWLTGLYIAAAIGIVLVVLTTVGWVRQRGAAVNDGGQDAVVPTSDVVADTGD